MTPKFKVGDRVVFVKNLEGSISEQHYNLGKAFTIADTYKTSDESIFYLPVGSKCAFYEQELVSEEIYLSPLFEALK